MEDTCYAEVTFDETLFHEEKMGVLEQREACMPLYAVPRRDAECRNQIVAGAGLPGLTLWRRKSGSRSW